MKTASLRGRRLTENDLSFVADVWNDERVAPMIGGKANEEQVRQRLKLWTRHWNAHGFGPMLFHERRTRQPVGWGGLQHSIIGVGECLTVGYVIAPRASGLGYATEIAAASVAHAFEELGASRLYASVLSTNGASRRVLEKAGLAVHREIDHGEHIEVIYLVEQ
jgi:RimJ/RimL family protein N-acetyltransferase